MISSYDFLCWLACANDFDLLTNLMGEFSVLLYVESWSTSLNTFTFTLIYFTELFAFTYLIQLPKHLHRIIWSTLEEVLDILCHSYKIIVVCIWFWASERELPHKRFATFISFFFILIKYGLSKKPVELYAIYCSLFF